MENCGTDARRLDVFYHLYAPRPSWRHQNQYTVTLKEQVSLPGLYKEVLNCKSGLLPSRWRRQNLLPKTWTIWCASWVFSAFSQCSDCNTLHGRKHLFCLLYGFLTVDLSSHALSVLDGRFEERVSATGSVSMPSRGGICIGKGYR